MAQRRKTTAKTAIAKKPQPHGGALNAGGTPGNKGGGRPPDAFKAMCRSLASSDEVEATVKKILNDSTHPAFVGALKWATEHGFGKPVESIEHSGPDGGPIPVQVWRFGKREVAF